MPDDPPTPTPPRPRASVVVPTRDRPEQLARCLAALDRQVEAPVEVLVVDDASTDAAAVRRAVADRPGVRLVRGAGTGPAAARNLGAREARGDVICFTDDDCRPEPDWIAAVLDRVAGGAAAVAGPTVNGRPDDPFATASQAVTNHLVAATQATVPFAPTSNLAVRADVFGGLPFDESFPLAAGEDREWCERLAARGHALELEPAAVVVHHQELSARRFWRQQVRYGRGALHLRRRSSSPGMQPRRFYVDLVRTGFSHGPTVGALVLVSQLATAAGLAWESFAHRRSRRASGTS